MNSPHIRGEQLWLWLPVITDSYHIAFLPLCIDLARSSAGTQLHMNCDSKTQYLYHTCARTADPCFCLGTLLTVTRTNTGTCWTNWRFSSYMKRTQWACASPLNSEPYGFTITQAATESCRNDMSNSQQIITVGLDTLHRRQLWTSVIILLMDTLIYFQKSYSQTCIYISIQCLTMNKGIHDVLNQKSSNWFSKMNYQTHKEESPVVYCLIKKDLQARMIKTQHLQPGSL